MKIQVKILLIGAAILIALSLSVSSRAQTNSFMFEKIADLTTAVPSGRNTFKGLHDPVLTAEGVALFRGRGKSDQRGIYAEVGGRSAMIADANTVLPGATGLLSKVRDLSVNSHGQLVFEAKSTDGHHGIYADLGGGLILIANLTTPIPAGSGNFISVDAPMISDAGEVFFRGEGNFDQRGLYSYKEATLSVVADRATVIPDGKKFYTNLRHPAINRHGMLAFKGKGHNEQHGIYAYVRGELTRVADRNTPVPDGIKTFKKFRKPSIDDENRVVFKGKGGHEQRGIYALINGILEVVADQKTTIPGGSGRFSVFGIPSIDHGHVAFTASGENEGGLYTTLGGSLRKVLSLGDVLDGKTVMEIVFRPDGLRSNTLAFKVIFTDATRGLYLAHFQGD